VTVISFEDTTGIAQTIGATDLGIAFPYVSSSDRNPLQDRDWPTRAKQEACSVNWCLKTVATKRA